MKIKKSTPLILIIIWGISIILFSCKEDASLNDNQEMYDYTHLIDTANEKDKKEVLKTLINLHDWYLEVWNSIRFDKQWYMDNTKDDTLTNKERIQFITDSIIPKLHGTNLLSQNLKNKAFNNFQNLEDPGNLAILLTGNNNGNVLTDIVQLKTTTDRYFIHRDYLHTDSYLEEVPPPISYEEAEYYHLSMIKLLGEKEAVYKVNYDLVSIDMYSLADYLLIFLVKNDENNWIIDDMVIVDNGNPIKDKEIREFIPWEEPIDINDPDFLP